MLLWLQKKAKATHIWVQFTGAVFVIHALVLLVFFLRFVRSGMYHFSLNRTQLRSEAPVLFIPLEQKTAVTKKAEAPVLKKSTAKKTVQTPVSQKAVIKKEESKPVVEKKLKQKKPEEKPVAKTVSVEQNPPSLKASASAKSSERDRSDGTRKDLGAKNEQTKAVTTKPQDTRAQPLDQKKELQSDEQRVITTAHEREQIAMSDFLSCTIGPRWKPPCCGDAQTECQVKFSIGHDRKIVSIEVVKSSGILLFDIAARNACAITESFPAWAVLKEFCITMKV